MTTKPEILKIPPEQVEFRPGEFYYVKRKKSKQIEGLRCIATDTEAMSTTQGMGWARKRHKTSEKAFGPDGTVSQVYLDTDIEYVLGGIPVDILHEANIRMVWGV